MIAPLVFAILIALVIVFLVLAIAYFVFPASSPSTSSLSQASSFTLRLDQNLVVEGESIIWQVTIPEDGNWIILSSFYILPAVNSTRYIEVYIKGSRYAIYISPNNAVTPASLTPVLALPFKQGDLVVFQGRNVNNPFTLQAENTFVSFTKT